MYTPPIAPPSVIVVTPAALDDDSLVKGEPLARRW